MLEMFQSTVDGIEAKLREGGEHVARKRLALAMARLGVELYSGKQHVAWCGVLAPFDLLRALDVTPCYVEFVGATLAQTELAGALLERAEQAGFSTDSCSYHRAVTGAHLQGLMPRPDFLVATSAPCTGGVAIIENLAGGFGKDLFVLHIPGGRNEEAVRHLASQYRALVDFIAARTGKPLEPGRLRAVIERTNRTRALLLEAYELARAIPSPARSRDLVNFGIVMALVLGTEEGVEIATAYRDEFARKAAAGVGGVRGERVRLMWLQTRIQFRNPLEELLEEAGASVVIDELNDIVWEPIDPDDPFVGLARRTLSTPLAGTAEYRIQNLQRLARAFRVDGAINPCQWGCRQGTGARGLVERGLAEVGVPVLNLEVDCVDQRNFAPGQLRTRVEAFLEMLLEKGIATREAGR